MIRGQQFSQEPMFSVPSRPLADEPLRGAVRAADLAVNVPLHNLPRVAETGDIRTQFETGDSAGTLDPEWRAEREAEMGFSDHPVYGYLRTRPEDNPFYPNTVGDYYGEARFTMRPHVRDRTTVLGGDSLEATGTPVPLRDVEEGRSRIPDAYDNPGVTRRTAEAEAQIHSTEERAAGSPPPVSRIPLSDVASLDIDHERGDSRIWSFTGDENYSPEERVARHRDVGQQFADMGIPVRHNIRRRTYQAPLPFAPDELAAQGFDRDPRTGEHLRGPRDKYGRLSTENVGTATETHLQRDFDDPNSRLARALARDELSRYGW